MDSREQGDIQFKAGNYAESIPYYRAAVEDTPSDHYCWGQLVLALGNNSRHSEAVEVCKSALRSHPRSAWLWRQLGNELFKLDHLEEAEKALDQSKRLDPEAEWLWRYYAQLYQKQEKYNEEAESLKQLIALGNASGNDVNRIGIAYRNNDNFSKAIAFYRMSARLERATAPYFNMGLVFDNPEVSQDVDAADAYRRALSINPDYSKAKEELVGKKAKLGALAEQALAQAVEIDRGDEQYQYYLNPFEVLQISAQPVELDVKTIQRAKKRLLQELDLNDGKVSWLNEQPLDRSRALTIDEGLVDVDIHSYHRLIIHSEPLLRFLTHGDIRHFLYSDEYFPEEVLDKLDVDEGFLKFLSRPFATQYNAVLSRAIDKKALAIVEVLFDGRRWVEDADLDQCLAGAFKRVGSFVDMFTELNKQSESRFVGYSELQNAFKRYDIVELFNLLPVQFRAQQTQLVGCVRSIAVNCHNKHGETAMSRDILLLCKKFQFKSHELNEKLKEDYKKVEDLILEQEATKSRIATIHPPSSPSLSVPSFRVQQIAERGIQQNRSASNQAKTRNSDLCYFCERNSTKTSTALRQPAYRVLSQSNRLVQYSRAEIEIERCASCKAIHENASMIFWGVAIVLVGGSILLSFAEEGFFIFAMGFAIALAAGKGLILTRIAKGKGTQPATKNFISKHPVLKAGASQGWSLYKP